ncbi:MAG: hypothetical protein HHAS10_01730 [Candidatus Altimarinota bacterium]
MEVYLFDNDQLPKLDDTYPTFQNIEPTLRERIGRQDTTFRSLAFPDSVYFSDPLLPDNPEQLETYLVSYVSGIYNFKNKHPSLAYFRLTQVLRDVQKFPKIVTSPIYLRVKAEWIAAAMFSGDFSSVYDSRVSLESSLSDHISRMTHGVPLQSEGLVLDDEMIYEYRAHLLQFINYFSKYYYSVGLYNEASIISAKGIKIAALMSAAHPKFNLLLDRLMAIIEQGEFDTQEFQETLRIGRIGSQVLTDFFEQRGSADVAKTIQDQLKIVELYGEVKSFKGCDALKLAEFIQRWEGLNNNATIDQDDRAKLAHIEMMLYVQYRDLQEEQNSLLDAKSHHHEEFNRILLFGAKLVNQGFELDKYKDSPDARFFLASFIDHLEFNVRSLVGSSKGKTNNQKILSVRNAIVDIYRLAVGVDESGIDVFRRMSFYRQFINAARLYFHHIGVSDIGNDNTVLMQIRLISQELEQEAHVNHGKMIEYIVARWKRISQISLSKTTEDGEKEDGNKVIYEGNCQQNDFRQVIHSLSGGAKYKFTVAVRGAPFGQRDLALLATDLAKLLAYETKKMIETEVSGTMRILRHDLTNLIGSIGPASQLLDQRVSQVEEEVDRIIGIPGNPRETVERLERLSAGNLKIIRRLTAALASNASGIGDFTARMVDEIDAIMQGYKLSRQPLNVTKYISDKMGTGAGQGIDFQVIGNDTLVLVNIGMFGGLVDNIVQNAKRYKRPTEEKAKLTISIHDSSDGVTVAFMDEGIGMTNKAIGTFLSAHTGAELDYGSEAARTIESKRLGAKSIMNTVRAHNASLQIESEVGKYTNFLFTFPKS